MDQNKNKLNDSNFFNSSDDDVQHSFEQDIFNAASKYVDRKKIEKARAQGKKVSDSLIWETDNLLSFKDFCASSEHLNFPPLSPRQLRLADYMFGDDPKKIFDTGRNTAVLVWGKGSGKDKLSAMMNLYIIYILLNLKNPQHYMGLPDHDNIDLLNVAASKEQAQRVYFEYLKNFVLHWSWLKNKYSIQLSGKFFSSSKKGMTATNDKVILTTDAIIFPKYLRAFSGSSEAETLEGSNLLLFVLDEADAFKTNSVTRSADKIYRTLRTSAVSRFKKRFKAFLLSYPRSRNGFIMKRYEDSKRFLSHYADKGFTWEVKPRHMFSEQTFEYEGHQVPMDFYDEFRLDPMGSKAAYLCDPPMAEASFFEDPDKIDLAARGFGNPTFEFRDIVEDGKISKTISKHPYLPDRMVRHILTLDLGLSNNATALSLMHREAEKIVVDFSTVWVPDKDKGYVVDLENVEDIIKEICNTVTVEGVFTDQWQSAMLVQRLRSAGILAEKVKLAIDDWELFKRLVYAGNVQLVRHQRLVDELRASQLFSGGKVDHPEGGTNDMAVTIVMGTRILTKVGKGELSSNLAAEGEYVGENLYEAIEPFDDEPDEPEWGIQIDGMPI